MNALIENGPAASGIAPDPGSQPLSKKASNMETISTNGAALPADIDALPGLREAVYHLEAASALLREAAPSGFQVLIREVIHGGNPFEELLTVHVLEVEESNRAFGPIEGRSVLAKWRSVWSGPVA